MCTIQEPELRLELLLHQDGMDAIFCAKKPLDVFILNGLMIKTQVCSFYYIFYNMHSSLKQCFSFYVNKVLQLMSTGASWERFGKRTLFLKTNGLYHCPLLSIFCQFIVTIFYLVYLFLYLLVSAVAFKLKKN